MDANDADDPTRELARGTTPGALGSRAAEELALDLVRTREALARLLEQQTRDASANRAQARELIKALEQLQASQEYVGRALREDRRAGRWLTVLAVVGPLAAAALIWGIWGRMDEVRQELGSELRAERDARGAMVATVESAARKAAAAAAAAADDGPVRDDRVDDLSADIETMRRDLAGAQGALGDERRRGEERERELADRMARTERELGQLPGLRAQLESVRERAAADAERADALERELERLRAAETAGADDVDPVAAAAAAVPPAAVALHEEAVARTAASGEGDPGRGDAARDAPTPALDPAPGAVRDPGSLGEIRSVLNDLLEDATGAVRYDLDTLGGVSGKALIDVVVLGRDQYGDLVRRLEAPRAEIHVLEKQSRVRMHFRNGHLVVGERRAPFFMGSYELVLDVEPARWKASGLNCVQYN